MYLLGGTLQELGLPKQKAATMCLQPPPDFRVLPGCWPTEQQAGLIISITGLLCSLRTSGNCLMSPAQSSHIFVIAMNVLQTTIWGLRQGIFSHISISEALMKSEFRYLNLGTL